MTEFGSDAILIARKGEVLGDSFDHPAVLGARAILRGDDGRFQVYLGSLDQHHETTWANWDDTSYPTQFSALIAIGAAYRCTIHGKTSWFLDTSVQSIRGEAV